MQLNFEIKSIKYSFVNRPLSERSRAREQWKNNRSYFIEYNTNANITFNENKF